MWCSALVALQELTATSAEAVVVVDVSRGRQFTQFQPHDDLVVGLAIVQQVRGSASVGRLSTDARLITASGDGTIRCFDVYDMAQMYRCGELAASQPHAVSLYLCACV